VVLVVTPPTGSVPIGIGIAVADGTPRLEGGRGPLADELPGGWPGQQRLRCNPGYYGDRHPHRHCG
jgi:hypothetical protein